MVCLSGSPSRCWPQLTYSEAFEDVPMHLDRLGLSTLLGVIPGHLFRPQACLEAELFVEAEDRVVVVRIDNDQSRSGQARRVENVAEKKRHQDDAHTLTVQVLVNGKSPDLDGGKGCEFDLLTEPQLELLRVVELDRVVGRG